MGSLASIAAFVLSPQVQRATGDVLRGGWHAVEVTAGALTDALLWVGMENWPISLGLVAIAIFVYLLIGARNEINTLQEEKNARGHRLIEFRNLILNLDPAHPTITLWKEKMRVRRGGHVSIERRVDISIVGPKPLRFWQFVVLGEPLSVKERKAVRPTVRMEPGGGVLDLQIEWETDKRLVVFADFPAPVTPQSSVSLTLTVEMPRALPKIWGDGSEKVTWFSRPERPIRQLEFEIQVEDIPRDRVLPYTTVNLSHEPTIERDEEGRWQIEGKEDGPPHDKIFGLKLDATRETSGT